MYAVCRHRDDDDTPLTEVTAMALSWAVVVASELIAAQVGLGYLIQSASQVYAINKVYVGVALIGLVGVSIDLVFQFAERRLLHWVGQIGRAHV